MKLFDRLREKMNRGWREAFEALGVAVLLGLAIAGVVMLMGCSGTRVLAEYAHGSSAQDFYDLNTTDQAGIIVAVPLRFRVEHCSKYCPELEAGLSWELTGRPTYGRDPVGTLRIRQPLFVKE
jgi:hypothetical protein